MKYLAAIFLFIFSIFLGSIFNFNNTGWQLLQPFLVTALLIYFNNDNQWLIFGYAALSGLYVDSLTGIFGFHAIVFITIIFLLSIFQSTILTSKNILTVILLSAFSFVFYWFIFWFYNFIFNIGLYVFNRSIFIFILRTFFVNILSVIFWHLLYYNLWQKKRNYGEKQSF